MLDFLLSMVETEEQRTFIEQFYLEYKDRLIAYAYTKARALNLFNYRSCAEESVQETFLRIIHKINFFMALPCEKYRPFAFKVLGNVLLERYRKEHKAANTEELQEETVASSENMELTVIDKLTVEEIKEAAKLLPPKQQEVFFMWCILESSHKEISDMLGITETNSQTLLGRAKESIRQMMQGGGDSNARRQR